MHSHHLQSDRALPSSFEDSSEDLVVLRSPFLPLETLEDIYAATDLKTALMRALSEPLFLPALYIASPTLADAVEAWRAGSEIPERAIVKALTYAVRMSARCTPFGLFATVTPVDVKRCDMLILGAWTEIRTMSRLDAGLLMDLASRVEEG